MPSGGGGTPPLGAWALCHHLVPLLCHQLLNCCVAVSCCCIGTYGRVVFRPPPCLPALPSTAQVLCCCQQTTHCAGKQPPQRPHEPLCSRSPCGVVVA